MDTDSEPTKSEQQKASPGNQNSDSEKIMIQPQKNDLRVNCEMFNIHNPYQQEKSMVFSNTFDQFCCS